LTYETYIREDKVEGVGPWVWPLNDTGAWIGPAQEFGAIRDHIFAATNKRHAVVQAGGCCGMYPRLWAEHFDWVYTFEPSPENWNCLVQNCPDPKIIKHNVALGEFKQEVLLKLSDPTNVGMSSILTAPQTEPMTTVKVPQIALDSLDIYCDVIQWDLEGYEPVALLGAERTIRKSRPIICLESVDDIAKLLLADWGYRIASQTIYDTIFVPY
jgi:FkbM family methyltransferase